MRKLLLPLLAFSLLLLTGPASANNVNYTWQTYKNSKNAFQNTKLSAATWKSLRDDQECAARVRLGAIRLLDAGIPGGDYFLRLRLETIATASVYSRLIVEKGGLLRKQSRYFISRHRKIKKKSKVLAQSLWAHGRVLDKITSMSANICSIDEIVEDMGGYIDDNASLLETLIDSSYKQFSAWRREAGIVGKKKLINKGAERLPRSGQKKVYPETPLIDIAQIHSQGDVYPAVTILFP